MVRGPIKDVQDKIINLLDGDWTPGNTPVSEQPQISTGEYEETGPADQIIIGDPNKDLGDYNAMEQEPNPGPVHHASLTVEIICNAGTTEDRIQNGPHPEDIVEEYADEVSRIIHKNWDQMSDFLRILANEGTGGQENKETGVRWFRKVFFHGIYRRRTPQ